MFTKGKWEIHATNRHGDYYINVDDGHGTFAIVTPRVTKTNATQEAEANAQRIVQCVNNFDALRNSIQKLLDRWDKSGPNGSAQWEKFDAAILGLRETFIY